MTVGLSLPSGTVTFLFTDVEGSTRLWEACPSKMSVALARHDELLRAAIETHGGYVFTTAGDSFSAAFSEADGAVATALEAQSALESEVWPDGATIRVRMGLHAGTAEEREDDYVGLVVNRAARIMSAGHGGQILASLAVVALVGEVEGRELGEHRLKDLSAPEWLWQVGGGVFPPLRTLDVIRHNLPVERTTLVGRKIEIDEIAEMLSDHRLVTLLGIGGSGKTRLATAAAAEVAHRFSDGVWLVDLVPAADAGQIAEAIARAAGFQVHGADLVAALADLVEEREMLIVLDSCEHVTDDAADVVDELLETASVLRVLATSREPLQLPDERQMHVAPLEVSEDLAAPAVALFAAAAQRVGASITPDDVAAVSQICLQLDGHPLSVELAASQLRQLDLDELASRMGQRFELLTRRRGGPRGRQASLQAVLGDTWAMLDAQESELLMQLAAFPFSFGADDVESVTQGLSVGAAVSTLAGLVDRGLIAHADEGRHRLLETVKLYAQQRWADTAGPGCYLDRHSRWLIDELGSYPIEDRYTSYLLTEWTVPRYEDLRAVEDRLVNSERIDELIDLLSALTLTYAESGPLASAVIERIERYLDELPLTEHQRGTLGLTAAMAGTSARRPDWIIKGARTAVEAFRASSAPEELAMSLVANAWMDIFADPPAALAGLEEARAIADDAGATALADVATGYYLCALSLTGQIDQTLPLLESLRERLDERPYDHGWALYYHQMIAAHVVSSPHICAAAVADWISRSGGITAEMSGIWAKHLVYCITAAATGDISKTRQLLAECQDLIKQTSADDGLPDLLIPLVVLAWRLGDLDRSRRWLTAIRHSPRPTLALPISIHFRLLRNEIGLDADTTTPPELDDSYQQALRWLETL